MVYLKVRLFNFMDAVTVLDVWGKNVKINVDTKGIVEEDKSIQVNCTVNH